VVEADLPLVHTDALRTPTIRLESAGEVTNDEYAAPPSSTPGRRVRVTSARGSTDRELLVIRRLTCACAVGLLVFATAACSSGGTTATTQTTAGSPRLPTTTAATTTTLPGTVGPGTPQTATSSSGQKVTVAPTKVQHNGALLTGPPDSWDLGVVLNNVGPGPYQSVPVSQVAVIDSSGQSHAPVIPAHPTPAQSTPELGMPATLAAGGQFRMLLFFVLPKGTTPTTVTFTPFGASAPALQWAA
jgi:hypothetical protein